jgi:hypothetical protein
MGTLESEIQELRGYRGTSSLAVWAGLPAGVLRRELLIAEVAGAVRQARIGCYRLVPESELPALERWLRRRGRWQVTTPASG